MRSVQPINQTNELEGMYGGSGLAFSSSQSTNVRTDVCSNSVKWRWWSAVSIQFQSLWIRTIYTSSAYSSRKHAKGNSWWASGLVNTFQSCGKALYRTSFIRGLSQHKHIHVRKIIYSNGAIYYSYDTQIYPFRWFVWYGGWYELNNSNPPPAEVDPNDHTYVSSIHILFLLIPMKGVGLFHSASTKHPL